MIDDFVPRVKLFSAAVIYSRKMFTKLASGLAFIFTIYRNRPELRFKCKVASPRTRGKDYNHFTVVIYSCSSLSLCFTSQYVCSGKAIYVVAAKATSKNLYHIGLRGKDYNHFTVVIYSCSGLTQHVSVYSTSQYVSSGKATYIIGTKEDSINCLIHRPKRQRLYTFYGCNLQL
jgi:hypothetical protein